MKRSRSVLLATVAVVAAAGTATWFAGDASAAAACATAWSSSATYVKDNVAAQNGHNYTAKWWTQNESPATHSGQWDVWLDGGACGGTTTPSSSPSASPTTSKPTTPPASPSSSPTGSPTVQPTGTGSLPAHFLTGYWQNFVNGATPLKLAAVPSSYDLIAVAFADATATPGAVSFTLDPGLAGAVGGYTDAQFKADIATLHSRGKKVIISVGGEKGSVSVSSDAAAANFADSVYALIRAYGFDGVDIDLENGLNATYMASALRTLRGKAGSNLIITMAPQTIDMQSTGSSYFALALSIKDILTVVHTQFYNSGAMLGCDQMSAYGQGTENFLVALTCIQTQGGLRPDQVALGLPATTQAAGGGYVAPSVVNAALDCLARGTNCGTFKPPATYPGIRGAMTWSINWDVSNGTNWAGTIAPHLATLP
ncbi:cellulose-binding protein II [Actinoplanes sp. SE50]|uniref:chitinase n=1 Tax=unclassified Actinoplanes TaxID=2626549 RepID=UPI00023EE030|nr:MULTISPECIES: glycosyl hydrolase family 18 protein [unclassified Actinoplanes]AEV88402.1 Chitinase D [Actinoplanes sp. SE50/110]ATO86807.1 cellulose-binding protein II [Actinoplanes sp. SE50]SLM04225.1 cellulose-binding protein II [Actinoplanes sp. SE50/110]